MTGMDREAALLSEGAAEVNPVQLTAGLLSRALSRGSRCLRRRSSRRWCRRAARWQCSRADGVELEAKALVFATGYELADGVPVAGHRRTSTWAFATPPQPHAIWGSGELIWEASNPYLYIRTTADGRVVVGGEDEDIDGRGRARCPAADQGGSAAGEDQGPAAVARRDRRFRLGGHVRRKRERPAVDRPVPDMPNCYAVLGYGGNGITFGAIAAQIIAERLCGKPDPDEQLFAFGR